MRYQISRHARARMQSRGVSEADVVGVINNYQISRPGDDGGIVYEGTNGSQEIICVATVVKIGTESILIIKSAWKKGD